MSTTLRTLICSCQYLQEGDPRAALVLTHHACPPPHTVLPFQCGNHGGISGSAWGLGRGQGGHWRTGRRGAECVLRDAFPVTTED